jgi:hypothetical protein
MFYLISQLSYGCPLLQWNLNTARKFLTFPTKTCVYKFLEFLVLKQSAQCKKAARTAQTVLSQISRAFHFRDRHVFLRLYVQYVQVRPHLEFASPAWSPWLEADKELLEKIQRRAVNMVWGLRFMNEI